MTSDTLHEDFTKDLEDIQEYRSGKVKVMETAAEAIRWLRD